MTAEMYIRPCYRTKNGKRHACWALVESYRTAAGPRQRIVACLGEMDSSGRLGIRDAAETNNGGQGELFDEGGAARYVEVDTKRVRVENPRSFGCEWLGLELARILGLDEFFSKAISSGREEAPWPLVGLALVLLRLVEPSSELRAAEHVLEKSAISELLGIPAGKMNEDRMYRALDRMLPHKEALEVHLKERLGELFSLEYDLLLYDVTSTYFEGEANANPLAARGYSRDRRGDCKQVTIALVVEKSGIPLGYEVFAGNRHDSTTVEDIVGMVEIRYGRANRIWVMDRGMASLENMEFLKEGGRRYIMGTPKAMLRRFERDLLSEGWSKIREGLEAKFCASPGGEETFILCRSADRREKEKAIHARFEKRIEEGLAKIAESCANRRQKALSVERRVGRLLGQNSRAAGLFDIEVKESGEDGRAVVLWKKRREWREWSELSEGCYLLRTNISDWKPEDLWKAYIQLTEAESAFRVHKSDLSIRPIWHQKEDRVRAHIFVCFLAYVLWKTFGQLCRRAGLGDEPRRAFYEIGRIMLVDVVLPTRDGRKIRRRYITSPSSHQSILLDRLGLALPKSLEKLRFVV